MKKTGDDKCPWIDSFKEYGAPGKCQAGCDKWFGAALKTISPEYSFKTESCIAFCGCGKRDRSKNILGGTAVELFEAGILTEKDFEGCPSDNEGRFYWFLDRIVRREGIGDILADGTYWAAKK